MDVSSSAATPASRKASKISSLEMTDSTEKVTDRDLRNFAAKPSMFQVPLGTATSFTPVVDINCLNGCGSSRFSMEIRTWYSVLGHRLSTNKAQLLSNIRMVSVVVSGVFSDGTLRPSLLAPLCSQLIALKDLLDQAI